MRADLAIGGETAETFDAEHYEGLIGRVLDAGHKLPERALGPDISLPRILEIGAGTGWHTQFVRHRYEQYVLTDSDPGKVAYMAQKFASDPRLVAQQANATKLDFQDRSFDRLIASHVLEHIYRPQDVLREWVRVLKPGGVLTLIQPCDPGLAWRFGRTLGPRRRGGAIYDYKMALEHVNPIHNLVALVDYYFEERRDFWWPWRIPSWDLNLIYATNITIK